MLADDAVPGAALPRAREAGMLADASYALYQTERHPARAVDWQATLVAGHHAVRGAEALLRGCPTGCLLPCVDPLTSAAEDVARRYERAPPACSPTTRARRPRLPDRPVLDWPTDLGQDLYRLADLRVWLDGLRDDLGRIAAAVRDETDLRARVAHLADGAAG